MKKKSMAIIISALCAAACLAACNLPEDTAHEHTYAEAWTSDAEYHWHIATCEHTDEISGKAEHIFENGKCTVCDRAQLPQEHKHSFVDYVYNNDATCQADGTETAKCDGCDETDTRIKLGSKTSHIYEDYLCKFCEKMDPNAPVTQGLRFEPIETDGETVGYSVVGGEYDMLSELIIPEYYNDKPVLTIGEAAFCEYGYSKIVIPNTVVEIGDSSLSANYITSIKIPHSVKRIGIGAFGDCARLISVTIPNSVELIDLGAFTCSALDAGADFPLSSLVEIVVEEGNERYYSENNCVIDRQTKTLVAGCKTSIIPNDGSVEVIGGYVFVFCNDLKHIDIPDSVKRIEEGAFSMCTSLVSVNLPANLEYIGDMAFSGCNLKEVSNLSALDITAGSSDHGEVALNALRVYGEGGSSNIVNKDGFLFYADESADIYGLIGYVGAETNLTLPADINGHVYKILSYAFQYRTDIDSIVIDNSVTEIEENAFLGCTAEIMGAQI